MAMSTAIPTHAFMAAFLPIARASLFPTTTAQSITRQIPLLERLRSSTIAAGFIPIPGIIDSIWEGILKAVPKKKTSHMKKRHRFMAGKALKDVTALNTCSSCGRPKRAHVLCPYCVASVRAWFSTKLGVPEKMEEQKAALPGQLSPKVHYLGRQHQKKIRDEKITASKQVQMMAEERRQVAEDAASQQVEVMDIAAEGKILEAQKTF